MRSDHRAVLILLGLAVLGHGARWALSRPGTAPGGLAPLGGLTAQSVATQRDSTRRLARPLAPDERIDPDRAPAEELARLPRVGLALARRIVADRTERGPFGSLAGLDRVQGVGPSLLQILRPHLAFSAPAPGPGASPVPAPDLDTAPAAALDALPGVGPATARAIVAWREAHGRFAGPDDLAQVRGVGRTRAFKIWAAAHSSSP